MQANPSVTTPRTFIEQARRTQIVDAAILVIAERGYPQASYTRIAKQAGLSSTGLISYHFTHKQDLIATVVATIMDRLSQWMHERLSDAPTPEEALTGYIEGLITYMKVNGAELRALSSIVLHGGMTWTGEQQENATSGLESILRWGQETRAFRAFDVSIMATTIQRSLDGIPFLQMSDPDLDLDTYARELVDLFARATRRSARLDQAMEHPL